MTRFLRTTDGDLINADWIVRIREGKPVGPLGAPALPVTPDDDQASSNLIGEGVLLPDGRVVQPFD
jgi:hypothetical protein